MRRVTGQDSMLDAPTVNSRVPPDVMRPAVADFNGGLRRESYRRNRVPFAWSRLASIIAQVESALKVGCRVDEALSAAERARLARLWAGSALR
jgi:hypothetical protein